MSYRIRPGRTPAAEARRAAVQQLDRAIAVLSGHDGPDAEAVHDARKRIKKARSALRLIRADLPGAVRRRANDELRQVGRRLGGTRDADALVETADRLLVEVGDDRMGAASMTRLRDALARRAEQRRQLEPLGAGDVEELRRRLAAVAEAVRAAPSRADGWLGVEAGLRREHRRARTALADLPAGPSTEELHAWRKRVKDVWYHQRLLRDLWPEAQRPIVRSASHLADLLGDDHDLGVLQALLDDQAEGPTLGLGDGERLAIAAVLVAERARLQGEARRLGALLLADRPGAWARRHRGWWLAAASDVGTRPRSR